MGAFDTSYAAGGMADAFAKLLARRDLERQREREYQLQVQQMAEQQQHRQQLLQRQDEDREIQKALRSRALSLEDAKRLEGTPVSQIPFDEREGPDGGPPIVSVTNDDRPERVNRFKARPIPGAPKLGIPETSARPRTREELVDADVQAALAKEATEGVTLGPQQKRFVGGREVASNDSVDQSDIPALQREFEYAKSQGFKGGFMDYIVAKKERPASPDARRTASAQDFREVRALAADYRKNSSDTYEMRGALSAMKAGFNAILKDPGGVNGAWNAGSQAIISRFNKLLDPGSVVRESEYARSPQGVALLNRIQGIIDRVSKGGAGVPVQDLKAFVTVAEQIMSGQEAMMKGEFERIQRFAKFAGDLPEDLIFTQEDIDAHQRAIQAEKDKTTDETAGPSTPGGDAYDRLQQRIAAQRAARPTVGVKPAQRK